jgi:hypothetical protein
MIIMTKDEIISNTVINGERVMNYVRYEDDGTILQYYTIKQPLMPEELEALNADT